MNPYQRGEREITVIGEGNISVPPNMATIQLGVVTLHEQASVAEKENAEKMTKVLTGLTALGIKEEAIQTVLFNITPRYEYVQNEQQFIGYEVTNVIQVVVDDFTSLSSIIDDSVQHGVNQIGMLQFTYDHPSHLEQKTLQRAMTNANEKVLAIVEKLSFYAQPIPIKISEQVNRIGGIEPLSLSMGNVSTPIEQGRITFTSTLQVTYTY